MPKTKSMNCIVGLPTDVIAMVREIATIANVSQSTVINVLLALSIHRAREFKLPAKKKRA